MGRLAEYLEERAKHIASNDSIPWECLDDAVVLVTGSTGLIGSQLTRAILARVKSGTGPRRVVLPVRNMEKARSLFGNSEAIRYLQWAAGDELPCDDVDYVVHGAAPTSSRDFFLRPVEVIEAVVDGTRRILELARRTDARKVVFLSTMEVYGAAFGRLGESDLGPLDPMEPRSSYPESKRLSENLVASYASEYGTPACVLRLAQTFGEGVPSDDGRAFADFGRHAIANEDVVLFTAGTKRNSYLAVDDAVSAIITLLAKGEPGVAYNGANEATYCSVRELAQQAIDSLSSEPVEVVIQLDSEKSKTFRAESDLNLDSSRLRSLGWEPGESLDAMFRAMSSSWEMERG